VTAAHRSFRLPAFMNHGLPFILIALGLLEIFPAVSAAEVPLVARPWFEARTAHFNVYSCGAPQAVFKVAGQLEQFCEAYSLLAGAAAVASPPVIVMAFPDHESLKPFLPVFNGQPANLAAFFQRGTDENLIVLSLPEADGLDDMSVVFHEYTHLLLRRNDQIWPLWLKEGMAEIYSTFLTTGYSAVVALPIGHHLQLFAHQPLLPLAELFAVTHDSPSYNERDRQGMFYAESWLLTHFLFAGDNPYYRARFGRFTTLLRAGQPPVQAFTNALGSSLPAVEMELRRYLARGQFTGIPFTLPQNVATLKALSTRELTPVEKYFRLGDELLRIDRPDAAEKYFGDAQKLAPASPLPYEGLGLVATRRDQPAEAVRRFHQAASLNSSSFLVYYLCAWQQFKLAAGENGKPDSLPGETAAAIHDELLKSLALMPNFAPAHELFGVVAAAQENQLPIALAHLQLAVQLAPENLSFQLTLAEAQAAAKNWEAARNLLAPLLRPTVEEKLRQAAANLLQEINAINHN